MEQEELYDTLLELYTKVYESIGVVFETLDKYQDFFLEHEIDSEVETKIVNEFLNSHKLTKLQKQVLKNNYYMGCAPKEKKV